MKSISTLARIGGTVGILSLLGLGCVEVNYDKVHDGGANDREVQQDLSGPDADLATEPDTADCQQAAGPVKVLLMVDTSASMMFTDPVALRKTAVEQLFNHFKDHPQVSFAVMTFSNAPWSFFEGVIFSNFQKFLQQKADGLAIASGPTDLQSALSRARTLLEFDMSMVTADFRAATRYVVVLITDGNRGPVCQAGCDNDFIETIGLECADQACGAGLPTDPSFCDLPRDQWCEAMQVSPDKCHYMTSYFPELRTHCQEFNTDRLIVQEIDELIQLQQAHLPGALELHTVRILEQLEQETQDLLGLHPAEDGARLQQMATKGGGTFVDAQNGVLDLTQLDLSSIHCTTLPAHPSPAPGECFEPQTSGGGGGLVSCKEDKECEVLSVYALCHPTLKVCTECVEDAHCAYKAPISFCSVYGLTAICAECREDSHCVAGKQNTGMCRPPLSGPQQCDRCETNQDCQNAGLGRRCFIGLNTGSCRECFWDGDCVKGPGKTARCDGNQTCSGCLTNQDCRDAGLGAFCKLDFPYHLSSGRCVRCLNDEHCTKGAEDTGRCTEAHQCLGCDTIQECAGVFPDAPSAYLCSAEEW